MEEGKCKDENFVVFRLVFVSLEELLAGDRVGQVGSSQVSLQALRRLICHFHTVLQNRSREFLGRVGSEPKPKVWFGDLGVWGDLLADPLEGGHPGDCQMAVLQHNPVSSLLALLDHLLGYGTLALPQRDRLNDTLFGLSERAQGGEGIRSGTQDEDKRASRVRVGIDLGKIEGRRRDELLSQFSHDIILAGRDHLVRSDSPQYEQFFEGSKDLLHFSRHLLVLWLFGVVNLPPFVSLGLEALEEGVELLHEGEPVYFSPALLGNPF